MLRESSWIKRTGRKVLGEISPKLLASIDNFRSTGRIINWSHPHDLNEKILWLSLYSDTSEWSILADKYAVREVLASKGYDNILPKLYGVWDDADDIDFETLPNEFILKTNHGSGTNIIVKNKNSIDQDEIRKKLNEWLKLRFGWPYEPHYLKIQPKIIAEELLDCRKQPIKSSSLIDYKCWFLDGKIHIIWTAYDRSRTYLYADTHYPDWSYHPELSVFSNQYRDGKNKVPKPINLDKMINVGTELSQGFPQVRIDFYEVDNHLYFGEMTFTSNSGTMTYLTKECLMEMGKHVTLPSK